MFAELKNNFKMEEESQERSLTNSAFEKKNTTLSLKQKKIQSYKKRKIRFKSKHLLFVRDTKRLKRLFMCTDYKLSIYLLCTTIKHTVSTNKYAPLHSCKFEKQIRLNQIHSHTEHLKVRFNNCHNPSKCKGVGDP